MTFKLSSLSLFLILLFVIFVSYFIGFSFPEKERNTTKENFISFDYGASLGSSIQIPEYSGTNNVNKVVKVYDNVFFDVYNGNLIEVDGSAFRGNSEVTGNSISKLHILGRKNAGNSVVTYNTPSANKMMQTNESQNTFTNSFKEFTYTTQSKNTDPYVVFYLPWNDSTYIHMIDISGGNNIHNHTHAVTELYYNTSQTAITYNNSTLKFVSGKSIDDVNTSNNDFVRLPSYDSNYSVFQMSSNIFFDVRNAQVIITNPDLNTLSVYPRKYSMSDDSLIKPGNYTTQTSIVNTDFNTWTAYDLSSKGNKMVLYISVGSKTMLVIIEPDNNNKYRVFNVKRFLSTGLDNGQLSVNSTTLSKTNTTPADPNSMMDDYYKWFYFNSVKGVKDPNSHNYNYSDDFILKTQIVPPVCPSCPTCPSSGGICTNCGGNGGSGTRSNNGQTLANPSNLPGQPITNSVNATTGMVNNAVNTTGNLLYAGASGTKDLIEDTGSGVKNFVENTGSGVKDLVEDTGSGLVNFAKSVGNGINKLGSPIDLNSTSDNIRNQQNNNRNFNDNNLNRVGFYNSNGQPVINQSSVTDPYSYFGAVPSKPSNYIPVTSDFSKFGR